MYVEDHQEHNAERSRGYAQLLLTATIEYLRRYDCSELIALIHRNNQISRAAHESLGFIQTDLPAVSLDGQVEEYSLRYVYRF